MGFSITADKLVIVGGSAGSMQPLMTLLKALPAPFGAAIVVVVHRQRNVHSNLHEIFSQHSKTPVEEPEDKDPIRTGHIYLAPQNYHLLLEKDGNFALEYSEAVCFSRPSIDVTLQSAVAAGTQKLLAILLSGANLDGAAGISAVLEAGCQALIQSPDTADFPAMPGGALIRNPNAPARSIVEISPYLNKFVL